MAFNILQVLRRRIYRVVHGYFAQKKFDVIQKIHPKYDQGKWDAEYEEGRWDLKRDALMYIRMGIVAAYFRFFKEGGRYLEIGCGAGELLKTASFRFAQFTGVDISELAIQRANETAQDNEVYICADANTYRPDGQYDVIVFTECLFYFDDPVGILRRYAEFLNPEGVIIVAMFSTMRSEAIWPLLDEAASYMDTTVMYRTEGKQIFRFSAMRFNAPENTRT